MATLSVPLTQNLEAFIEEQVRSGNAANKADVVRKALRLLAEEEAIAGVLKAEQEVRDGKALRGDLTKLARTIS